LSTEDTLQSVDVFDLILSYDPNGLEVVKMQIFVKKSDVFLVNTTEFGSHDDNNESFNHILKQKFDYKRSESPRFNVLLQDLCEEQQKEVEKVVFGESDYEIVEGFQNLEISHSA